MAISSRKQYQQVEFAIGKARLKEIELIKAKRTEFAEAYIAGMNAQFDKLVDILCEVYGKDNPSFDESRFRRGCGYSRPYTWRKENAS